MKICTMAITVLMACIANAYAVQVAPWTLVSPDKKINVSISNAGGKLSYQVAYGHKLAIEPSPLGIDRDDQQFSTNLKFVNQRMATVNESYTLAAGKKRMCRNHA